MQAWLEFSLASAEAWTASSKQLRIDSITGFVTGLGKGGEGWGVSRLIGSQLLYILKGGEGAGGGGGVDIARFTGSGEVWGGGGVVKIDITSAQSSSSGLST